MNNKIESKSLDISNFEEYLSRFLPKSNFDLATNPNSPEEIGVRMADETLDNMKNILIKKIEKS